MPPIKGSLRSGTPGSNNGLAQQKLTVFHRQDEMVMGVVNAAVSSRGRHTISIAAYEGTTDGSLILPSSIMMPFEGTHRLLFLFALTLQEEQTSMYYLWSLVIYETISLDKAIIGSMLRERKKPLLGEDFSLLNGFRSASWST
jgi:hypothetical protein